MVAKDMNVESSLMQKGILLKIILNTNNEKKEFQSPCSTVRAQGLYLSLYFLKLYPSLTLWGAQQLQNF